MRDIADDLRRRIVTGDLTFGQRLPSLQKLAELYGVSPPTVHAAVHAVAALGFVRVAHGVGTFVARPRSHAAVLNHAWLQATPKELAMMRAALDERMAALVAIHVAQSPDVRLPRTLSDINQLAHERSLSRHGGPWSFVNHDLAFHQKIASSVRGAEITAIVCERIGARLKPDLISVADVQAGDGRLDALHLDLAAAILNGSVISAARHSRTIARRELASLDDVLG